MSCATFRLMTISLTLMGAPLVGYAQTTQSQPPTSSAEVTPFVALGSLGASRVGGAVSFPMTADLSIEAELGYRRGEGGIQALSSHVNLVYDLPRIRRVTPYLTAGAGLEEYGEPVLVPGSSAIFTRSAMAFAINAGGGLKVPVHERWGLRTDARWFNAVGRGGSEHWRVYQGASISVGQ